MTILKRNKSPSWLVVDKVTNDNDSVITLRLDTKDMLHLFLGAELAIGRQGYQ